MAKYIAAKAFSVRQREAPVRRQGQSLGENRLLLGEIRMDPGSDLGERRKVGFCERAPCRRWV
jgi:hypothetical protein